MMSDNDDPEKKITLPELGELRRKSEIISQFLHTHLKALLETLQPLLAPERLLGKYAGGTKDIGGASKALAQLKAKYKEVCGQPFNLPQELNEEWLSNVGDRVELYAWEYIHEAKSENETKAIKITSPVCWVLNYRSGYNLSQLTQAITDRGDRQPEYIRQFVINSLLMDLVVSHHPNITQIFEGLRYKMKTAQVLGLGKLSLMTVASCLPSFRPVDDLILAATGFSGIPAFIELVDMEAFQSLTDPLKFSIEKLIK